MRFILPKLLACAALLAACEQQSGPREDDPAADAAGSDQASGDASAADAWQDPNAAGLSEAEAMALFLDVPPAKEVVFNQALASCGSFTGPDWSGITPWPAELKAFLGQEIRRLPRLRALLQKGLRGYYFTKAFPAGYGNAAGVFCKGEANADAWIFLNQNEFIEGRFKTTAPPGYALYAYGQQISTAPDLVLSILFHETGHAIDYLLLGGDAAASGLTGKRKELFDLSWTTLTQPKYPPPPGSTTQSAQASLLATASSATTICGYAPRRPHHAAGLASGFNLFVDSKLSAADVRYYATQTDAFDLYSRTNAREDFAQTFALYFMATRYNQAAEFAAYQADVFVETVNKMQPLYAVNDLTLMQTSPRHHAKVCLVAALALGEDCEAVLKQARPDDFATAVLEGRANAR